MEYDQPDFSEAAVVAGEIVGDVLEHGMPRGAEVLNVNFPSSAGRTTKIALTEVAQRKYTDKVIVRKDPRGRPYYWLFGERLSEFPQDTDAEAVIIKRRISVTPIILSMSGRASTQLEEMRDRVEERLKNDMTKNGMTEHSPNDK